MHHTAKSNSVVCIILQSQLFQNFQESRTHNISNSPWYASLCRDNLRGMHYTSESISRVCTTPRSQSPRRVSHRGVNIGGMIHTSESESKILLVSYFFKGTIRRNLFKGKHNYRTQLLGFPFYLQYLAGCRESNPSCCDRSQVCYQ